MTPPELAVWYWIQHSPGPDHAKTEGITAAELMKAEQLELSWER